MLTIESQFVTGLGAVGLGYDSTRDEVLVYSGFSTQVNRFSTAGVNIGTFANPGETANDFDVDFVDAPLTMAGVTVAAGAALLINGESGVAEIRAVDPVTGAVLATLVTAFGVSHVVGGAYHADRGTFFLVQDQVPGGSEGNRIAEIDAETGAVINTFQIPASSGFSVNFGDLEVEPVTGELMIVSDNEGAVLRMSPEGEVLGELTLPGVGGLSGIAFIPDSPNEAFVVNTGGQVSRLSGFLGDGAIVGTAARDELTGTALAETIAGLEGKDTIRAGEGDDRLYGGAGADKLLGQDGTDQLYGDDGADTLTGGRGADRFLFGDGDTGVTVSTVDTIADFNQGQGDRIDLFAVDAIEGTPTREAFTFIGTDGFSGAAGELRYFFRSGDTVVIGDTDGDKNVDLAIRLKGEITLTEADFDLGGAFAAMGAATRDALDTYGFTGGVCFAQPEAMLL